ncbi:MAG: glutamate--tRNA ligase [Proteobacteria bacterium]|nr:glutamate--tRNA ligase [Pseudomonadota bacterium]
MLVTRFAPSPTGFLHIGSARTALFNWLYTRHHGGKFYLRIEDTDKARSTQAAIDAIYEGMRWLGLNWDGDVVLQSTRKARHAEVAKEMVEQGAAYYCYVTQEELDAMRQQSAHQKFQSPWRDNELTAPTDQKPVIRLKARQDGVSLLHDSVYGEVSVQNSELDDMVLLRADGTPTYMLAVVVDDHDMGVNYVIRGDDHFTNTFRQNQIYEAMGWEKPKYAHIPLIHGPDGGKLSKRHGALGVGEYKAMGYLPEAICSYLLRLGWSHGDLELIDRKEAIKLFDVAAVNKSPARFDWDKLKHTNAHYLRQTPDEELAAYICDARKIDAQSALGGRIRKAAGLLKARAATLVELAESAHILEQRQVELDTQSANIMAAEQTKHILRTALELIQQLPAWEMELLQQMVQEVAHACQCKPAQVMQALRAAVIGTFASPSIMELLVILGNDEVMSRMKEGIK